MGHPAKWAAIPASQRWLDAALADLDALRLALPDRPDEEFFAAGAPWFLTLFGRDSLWAARLALPLDSRIAASTLRVLARFQGERSDPESAQQPGKILHELRGEPLAMPGEGIVLPPRVLRHASTRLRCGCAFWRTRGGPGCRSRRCATC